MLTFLGACAGPDVTSGVNDPYEARNREVFEANLALDRALLSGAGEGVASLPEPVRRGFSNFSDTFGMPRTLVNDLLQLRLGDALHNSFRLAVNLTFGLGGLLDPATDMGLEARPADFGETLHVWGVGEGAYLVLPLLGPSTERDAVGKVVDVFTNPLTYLLPSPERYAGAAAGLVGTLGARGEYAEALEDIIYGSADPYAQARVIYLENRRFKLRDGAGDDVFIDPYEDGSLAPYADDGYTDPYENPYGE